MPAEGRHFSGGQGGEMDITGDAGDNLLDDTAGNDIILGLGGNDTIRFSGGTDVIRGGEGDDRVIIDSQPGPGSEFDGGAGTDTLAVRDFPQKMFVSSTMFPQGIQTVSGSLLRLHVTLSSFERVEFASTAGTVTSIALDFGNNIGSTGNPNYVSQIGSGISATAEIVGGDGFDALNLIASHTYDMPPGGYVLNAPSFTYTNWSTPTRAYLPGDRINIVQRGLSYGVINGSPHEGVQGLFGGEGSDTINGSDGMDFISGGWGRDLLYGGGGDDALALISARTGFAQAPNYTGETTLFDGGDGFDFLVLGGEIWFEGTVRNIEGLYLAPAFSNPDTNGFPGTSQAPTRVHASGDVLAQFPTDLEIDGEGTIVIELESGDSFDGSALTFTAGADVVFEITTGEFGETVIGTATRDLIAAGGGNDQVTGGGGNDEIDGGEGNDTAFFADALADCTISYEGNVVIVATKTQGTDRLENVETLNFAGVAVPVQIPVDTVPPTVTVTDDKPGVATGVVTYTLAFSENVTGLAADDFIISGGNGAGVFMIYGDDKDWTVMINPAALEGNLEVTLKAGAVTDAQGNANAAVVFAAQAIDTKPPVVVGRTPANGSTSARVDSDITLTFSEAVKRGTGTIMLLRYGVGQIEVFDVATSDRITVSGNTVTIDPTDEFVREGGYYIEAFGNTITDFAGNGFFGIESSYTSSFVVAAIAPSRLFTAPGLAASIGGKSQVIGTAGFQDITLLDVAGTITLDPSFNKGGDVIRLAGDASAYTIAQRGSSAVLDDGDSEIIIPVGTAGAALVFADGVRELVYDPISGKLTIGDQWFGSEPAPITAAPDGTVLPTGADPDATGRLYLAEDSTIAAAGDLAVIGTNRAEHLTLLGGDLTLDPSFNRGGDTVAFDQAAGAFTAVRSGSSVILTGAEGSVRIPVGTAGMTLDFDGDARTLVFVAGEVRIDDQAIPFTGVTLG